jgi:hypothetical protein
MFTHEMKKFKEFLEVTAKDNNGITPSLVEKDYWIMHCLWGLQQAGFEFYMKGGTSLSKGFKLIDRFSEDIDILIVPPGKMDVKTGQNHNKPLHIESRSKYYDYLAKNIKVSGITEVVRDHEFDDKKLRNGGIRLIYPTLFDPVPGLKEGILLEVGFATVTPNEGVDISSWALDKVEGLGQMSRFEDNRALGVKCFCPEYTFIEKLSAISFKYQKYIDEKIKPSNFLRHYYDIHQLLKTKRVQNFIGSKEYHDYKKNFFKTEDVQDLTKNDAFLIKDIEKRDEFEVAFKKTDGLHYASRPSLDEILKVIATNLPKL